MNLSPCIYLHCHYSLPDHQHLWLRLLYLTKWSPDLQCSLFLSIAHTQAKMTFLKLKSNKASKASQWPQNQYKLLYVALMWPSLTWPLPSFQHHLLLFSLLNCVLPPHQKFFWYHATCTNSYFHFRFIHTRIISVSIHYMLGLTMCLFNSQASLGTSLVSQWYLNAYIILGSITWDNNVLYGSLTREGAHLVPFFYSQSWLHDILWHSTNDDWMRCLFQEKDKRKEKACNLWQILVGKFSERFLK